MISVGCEDEDIGEMKMATGETIRGGILPYQNSQTTN